MAKAAFKDAPCYPCIKYANIFIFMGRVVVTDSIHHLSCTWHCLHILYFTTWPATIPFDYRYTTSFGMALTTCSTIYEFA